MIALQIKPSKRPGNWIRNSDIGIKLSAFAKGWDFTFNYLYHYEDFAALERSLEFNQLGQANMLITPTYYRTHVLGTSFNKPLSPITLRGEIAYTFKQYFSSAAQVSVFATEGP